MSSDRSFAWEGVRPGQTIAKPSVVGRGEKFALGTSEIADHSSLIAHHRIATFEMRWLLATAWHQDECFGRVAVGVEAVGEDMPGGQSAQRRIDLVDARETVARDAGPL